MKKIEKILKDNPRLSLSGIVSEALELWLKGDNGPLMLTRSDMFIKDDSQGFGPRANHPYKD